MITPRMLSVRSFWFPFLVFMANSLPAVAQENPCTLDLSFWRPGTFTDESVKTGDTLLVAPDFAVIVRQGLSDLEGSHMGYFDYLRPTSRKELRVEDIEETKWERIMPDGNVYNLKKLPIGQSVFEVPADYNAGFEPEKVEGVWVAPAGLTPWVPTEGPALAWVVVQKTSEFLLLKHQRQLLVYYRADNNLSYPFQRPSDLRRMDTQREYARSIRGKMVTIYSNHLLQIRSGFSPDGATWAAAGEPIIGQISNIFVLRDMVLIGLGTQRYVVMEGDALGYLRFMDCQQAAPVTRGN